MAIDIRAEVRLLLTQPGPGGTLISPESMPAGGYVVIDGSISDEPLGPETGLIATSGTVRVKGKYVSAELYDVSIAFTYKQGSTTVRRRIPRDLLAAASTYDPIQDITEVYLACKIKLGQDANGFKYVPFQEEGSELPDDLSTLELVRFPIRAQQVAIACARGMGFAGGIAGALLNEFLVSEFDLSGGYASVVSDLLRSEGRVGIAKGSWLLLIEPLGNSAAINLTSSRIIAVNPIGSGPYPSGDVDVNYSIRELQVPDEPEDKLAWERDISEGDRVTINLTNPKYLAGAQAGFAAPESFTYTYIPKTVTVTTYDAYDRVLTRTTTTNSILAEAAPAAVQAGMGGSALPGGTEALDWTNDGGGSQPVFSTTQEVFEYKIKAPLSLSTLGEKLALKYNPPLGYEDILRKTTIVTEPLVKVYAGTMAYDVALKEGFSFAIPTGSVITEKTIETYDIGVSAQGTNLTKTFVDRYKNQGSSIVGQQGIASAFDATREDVNYFNAVAVTTANSAANLKYIGREVKITEGRNVDLQRRPTAAERARKDFNVSDEAAVNNGYSLQQVSKSTTQEGSTSQVKIVTMPYACDPKITREGVFPFYTYTAQSPVVDNGAAAKRFGKLYVDISKGIRHGINVQVAAKDFLAPPCASVALSLAGATGAYVASGITYTFNESGIVASVDLLLKGGIGGGSPFFPVAKTITTLPTTPPVVNTEPTQLLGTVASVTNNPQAYLSAQFPAAVAGDGVQDSTTLEFWRYDGAVWVNVGEYPGPTMTVGSLIPLYNEIFYLEGRLRTRLSAVSLSYGLNLLTTVPTYGVKLGLSAVQLNALPNPVIFHFDGTNGSTSITSTSGTSGTITVTRNGATALSTTQAKFGTASVRFTSSGDNLLMSHASIGSVGTDDFTVDFWFYRAGTGYQTLMLLNAEYSIDIIPSGGGDTLAVFSEASNTYRIYHQTAVTSNAWHHVALYRISGTLYMPFNGVQATSTSASSLNLTNATVRLADYTGDGSYQFNGYIDEFRYTPKLALYGTTNFTPPTAADPEV